MSRRQLLALVCVALAVRMLYVAVVLADYAPASDADHYAEIATNVANGDGFSSMFPFSDSEPQPTAFRPPLYPMVLGGFYAVFGAHIGVAQLLNVVLGTCVVVLVAMVAHRMAGARAGFAAGLLAALYPPLLANDGVPLAEPLSLCLILLTVLFVVEQRFVWAGITTGMQVLTKPGAQGLVLVLAAYVVWRCGWRRAASFVAPVLLVVSPWIIRNHVVMGAPVVVTSNGFNLAALYSPQSRAAGSWLDPINDQRFESVRADATASGSEPALDEAFRQLALEELRAHPEELIKTSAHNAVRALELVPGQNDAGEVSDGRSLPLRYGTLWGVWAVTALGLAGLFLARRSPTGLLLVVSALCYTVISLPFSPMAPRLRAPLDLACCIGAAVVISRRGSPVPAARESPDECIIIDLRDSVRSSEVGGTADELLPQAKNA